MFCCWLISLAHYKTSVCSCSCIFASFTPSNTFTVQKCQVCSYREPRLLTGEVRCEFLVKERSFGYVQASCYETTTRDGREKATVKSIEAAKMNCVLKSMLNQLARGKSAWFTEEHPTVSSTQRNILCLIESSATVWFVCFFLSVDTQLLCVWLLFKSWWSWEVKGLWSVRNLSFCLEWMANVITHVLKTHRKVCISSHVTILFVYLKMKKCNVP